MGTNLEKLLQVVNSIEVNGPRYRGAGYPRHDSSKINEENYSDELRVKYYDVRLVDENTIDFEYISQSWSDDPDDIQELLDEIVRAFEYNATKFGITTPVYVNVDISSRDGDGPIVIDFEI